jgi:hypothetical protein
MAIFLAGGNRSDRNGSAMSLPRTAQAPLVAASCLVAAALAACRTTTGETDYFTVIDSNNDGRLVLEEVEAYGFRRMFNRFDKNRDEVITTEDLGQTAPNLMGQRDLDGDGRVTYEEYASAGRKLGTVKKLFFAADTNRDGSITRQEEETYLFAGGAAILGD